MRTTLVAIAILLAPHVAADPAPKPRERAAIVAIDLGPGTPPYLRETAAGQLAAGLAAAGYEVVPAAEIAARLTGELAGCRQGPCVRRVGQALGAPSLVFVTIDGKDENTIIAMRLHDDVTGERAAEVREVCDLCGQAELAERLSIAASALRARALETRERTAKQSGPAAPAGGRRSLVPGILVGAAGAIAIAGGAYLVAIDGRGTCHRGDQPVYPTPGAVIRYPDPTDLDTFVCRYKYETRAPGIASAATGVVALAAGVALILRARVGARAVEIVPRSGGAVVDVSWPW